VNGQYIEWKQLWDVYEKLSALSIRSQGLSIAPKLKLEHLKLSSYSRMRVDLAAQVSKAPLYNTQYVQLCVNVHVLTGFKQNSC